MLSVFEILLPSRPFSISSSMSFSFNNFLQFFANSHERIHLQVSHRAVYFLRVVIAFIQRCFCVTLGYVELGGAFVLCRSILTFKLKQDICSYNIHLVEPTKKRFLNLQVCTVSQGKHIVELIRSQSHRIYIDMYSILRQLSSF